MNLLEEQQNTFISFPNFLFALSLIGLLITIRQHSIDGYFGEPLEKRVCTISREPRFVGGGKVDVRITFNVNEMNSELWVINTAIREYRKVFPNPEESLKLGDVVEIRFPTRTLDLINKPLNHVPVFGLIRQGEIILDSDQVQRRDRIWIRWGYGLSISGIILGIALTIIRRIKRR